MATAHSVDLAPFVRVRGMPSSRGIPPGGGVVIGIALSLVLWVCLYLIAR